MSNREEIKSSY